MTTLVLVWRLLLPPPRRGASGSPDMTGASSDTKPIASLMECCCMGVVSQIKDLDNTSSLPASSVSLCENLRRYLFKAFFQKLVLIVAK